MSLGSLTYKPYSITSDEPFGTAHGQRSHTDIVLIKLQYDGFVGYGEASMPPYYEESQDDMLWFMGQINIDKLLATHSIKQAMDYIDGIAYGYTASKAAVDMALHDLRAKQAGQSMSQFLNIQPSNAIYSSMTIGLSDINRMLQEVRAFCDYPILKVKLGKGLEDIKIMRAIREISTQRIWVDANQGWSTVEEAIKIGKELEGLGVELIEQPFKKGDLDKVSQLANHISIPIVADEDCQRLSDIHTLATAYDAINIKLMKCTGIHEAMAMIKKAREHNLKIMLGCMTESSIAVSAACHLAPSMDWIDLDGNLLINNDPAKGIVNHEGCLTIDPEALGHGAVLRLPDFFS